MVNEHILALSTAPNTETANLLANLIIENRLAACVNIVPNINSIYRWEQAIENSSEVLMLIKTSRALFTKLEKFMDEQHPYQVPELISFAIEDGSNQYLGWINKCLE